MAWIDDKLQVCPPESEWACRPCPHCRQRFLTDAALRSHRDRYHPGASVGTSEEEATA